MLETLNWTINKMIEERDECTFCLYNDRDDCRGFCNSTLKG